MEQLKEKLGYVASVEEVVGVLQERRPGQNWEIPRSKKSRSRLYKLYLRVLWEDDPERGTYWDSEPPRDGQRRYSETPREDRSPPRKVLKREVTLQEPKLERPRSIPVVRTVKITEESAQPAAGAVSVLASGGLSAADEGESVDLLIKEMKDCNSRARLLLK